MKYNVLIRVSSRAHQSPRRNLNQTWLRSHRNLSSKARQRRDDIWIPTVNVNKQDGILDATELLSRAGYLRQAYAGIYHMLPLGLRVQNKLEKLIDKHMTSIGASKVSLSSISSQSLWQKSGRLKMGSELFTFADRKDSKWLLSPTHEEEITTLVADFVYGSQDLPIRLYQVGRKYRDEKRPRGGLLRGREFIMKDLYTFDVGEPEAHATYEQVRAAYRSFLDELKLPYIEARADSGNMGGNLSHEYHFPSRAGEDDIISCSKCGYARNEEFVPPLTTKQQKINSSDSARFTFDGIGDKRLYTEDFVSKDKGTLVRVVTPRLDESEPISQSCNPYIVKAVFEGIHELDMGVGQPLHLFESKIRDKKSTNRTDRSSVYYLVDGRLPTDKIIEIVGRDREWIDTDNLDVYMVEATDSAAQPINLLRHISGDPCPQCSHGVLSVEKAVEIGHTFHLGTRYSSKLGLECKDHQSGTPPIPVQMGCHGIGISRLVAAVAGCLSDEKGLIWPRVIAPFEVAILVKRSDPQRLAAAETIYDGLHQSSTGPVDVLLDDRENQSLGWKLKDADAIGYPVVIVMGKGFDDGQVEIQCRRFGTKEQVSLDQATAHVNRLLEAL